jgi:phosphate starvation-inducible PhoH-like protein
VEAAVKKDLVIDHIDEAKALFGPRNEHLKAIEGVLPVRLHTKGGTVTIEGDQVDVELSEKVLVELHRLLRKGYPLYRNDIDFAVRILSGDRSVNLERIFLDTVYISSQKRIITPKSVTQKDYIDAIRSDDMVIGIGPAGTGKTYLAMAMGLSFLAKKNVTRIVLTRPAVEAGEKLGFLPGDLY